MPCLAIHLAIAKKYLEKNNYENVNEFMLGSIAPDIDMKDIDKFINGVTSDKNSHHFGENYKTSDAIEYMQKKVNFSNFFASNEIDTSFRRAYFLHLLADYYFFGKYITYEEIQGLSLEEIVKIGFNDYDLITPFLINKFDITLPEQLQFLLSRKGEGKLRFLTEEGVLKFIDDVCSLDLEQEKEKFIIGNKEHKRA